jgi:hypothetical protein
MTYINWPHGNETLAEHLNRFSKYLYRKRKHDSGNLGAMMYGLYLHYNTQTGEVSELYADLNKPWKVRKNNYCIGELEQLAKGLIDRVQNSLNITAEK